jgi:cytochrome P450
LTKIDRQLNPFPVYETLRSSHPVYRDPERANWNVFLFEDVQRALSDYEVFSSRFGGESGYCLGAPLARLEARIALSAMTERFVSFTVLQDATLERPPSLIVYGLRSLPIRFERS